MMNKRIKLSSLAGLVGLIILLYASIPEIFIALLLGALFIPPVLVLTSMLIEGLPIMAKELQNLLASGKEFLLISLSKESITLEPQFR